MKQMGVISPIQEPTDWCAGMVAVQKKNGEICNFVDLTQLNENVKLECSPTLTQTQDSTK